MKDLAFPRPKRKHAQRACIVLFVTPEGLTRVSAPGRGGWRRPSALELALGLRPVRMPSRFQEEG
jgi:hypothetical protein